MSLTPYNDSKKSKKEQVASMFDNIAPKYDFLNHVLSLGIDKMWRRKMIKILRIHKPKKILDIATGTGDLAIEASKLKPESVTGIDISDEMLKIAIKKIEKKGLSGIISFQHGDSEQLSFNDACFDAAIVAFGVRNFENLEKGISEIYRVLKNNGVFLVLEFSKPSQFPVKQLYSFYFNHILPFTGRLISKDKSAYRYLPDSVNAFPEGKKFEAILQSAGFAKINSKRLTFGIASIYYAIKH